MFGAVPARVARRVALTATRQLAGSASLLVWCDQYVVGCYLWQFNSICESSRCSERLQSPPMLVYSYQHDLSKTSEKTWLALVWCSGYQDLHRTTQSPAFKRWSLRARQQDPGQDMASIFQAGK